MYIVSTLKQKYTLIMTVFYLFSGFKLDVSILCENNDKIYMFRKYMWYCCSSSMAGAYVLIIFIVGKASMRPF